MSHAWNAVGAQLPAQGGIRVQLMLNDRNATVEEVFSGWKDLPDFRLFFNSLPANCPFQAFRWETPPAITATLRKPFEFVLLDSPELVRQADAKAFKEHLDGVKESVISFQNLGGDATLVVPRMLAESAAYGHLGAFVRDAPEAQRDDFWKLLGLAVQARIDSRPVWVNTAGAGIPWLHLRLDDRPKYYRHAPYRNPL